MIFKPDSNELLVSVGDDQLVSVECGISMEGGSAWIGFQNKAQLILLRNDPMTSLHFAGPQVLFWDTRVGTSPTQRIEEAHGAGQDIQCVDWEAQVREGGWRGLGGLGFVRKATWTHLSAI